MPPADHLDHTCYTELERDIYRQISRRGGFLPLSQIAALDGLDIDAASIVQAIPNLLQTGKVRLTLGIIVQQSER